MRIIITTLCLVFIVFLLMLSAADKPDSKSRNYTITKGADMSNLQNSTQKGTGVLPPIDTLKPARIETATFALG
jgi:hypothetical protein